MAHSQIGQTPDRKITDYSTRYILSSLARRARDRLKGRISDTIYIYYSICVCVCACARARVRVRERVRVRARVRVRVRVCAC